VKAIAIKTNLARIEVESLPSLVSNGLLGRIKAIFSRYQTQIDFVSRSTTRISTACSDTAPLYVIAYELQRYGRVEVSTDYALVSCVGEGLRKPGLSLKVLQKLEQIDPKISWERTSALNFTTIVKRRASAPLIRRLHGELFEGASANSRIRA